MTITLQFYWWMLPLAITIIAFIPAGTYKGGDYDPTGAFLAFAGICVSLTAWVVAIIMRLAA